MKKIPGLYFYQTAVDHIIFPPWYAKTFLGEKITVERNNFGEFHTLMPELRQDEIRFYMYFRTPSECFDEILSLIKEDITKMDTNYREAISEKRLAITLR